MAYEKLYKMKRESIYDKVNQQEMREVPQLNKNTHVLAKRGINLK